MNIYIIILAALFTLSATPVFGSSQHKKILMVATNVEIVNGKINGTFLMEIAYPFWYLTEKGFDVDIVTPKGGKAALYHKGDTAQDLKAIALHPHFIAKTRNTLLPASIRPADYQAVIFPGGYGQFWDVCKNKEIAALTTAIYELGGFLCGIGHGTANFTGMKLSSNDYLVKGKRMTCFPSWSEREWMSESDYGRLLPFDMQEELGKQGALLTVCTKDTRAQKDLRVLVDAEHRIVTGSFATDAKQSAEELFAMMSLRKK